MTATLAAIARYPVKGVGIEPLDRVQLQAEAPMPGDRAWALLHEGAAQTDDWQPRRNFLVVANGPRLAQVRAQTLQGGRLRLTHPSLDPLEFVPANDGDALARWVRPIWPETSPAPTRLVQAPPQGMADNGRAEVSVLNLASLQALSDALGQPLQIERFRGNLVLDGLSPWEEFDWIGKSLTLGEVTLEVTQRIERCRATEASPLTGDRDALTVAALYKTWKHRDFGVYARVTSPGTLTPGDKVQTP